MSDEPINFSKLSTFELNDMRREINDKLVNMGAPRPFISPTAPGMENLTEEVKDLHSQYFAIMYVLFSRGVETGG
jgi:hypothetical protein